MPPRMSPAIYWLTGYGMLPRTAIASGLFSLRPAMMAGVGRAPPPYRLGEPGRLITMDKATTDMGQHTMPYLPCDGPPDILAIFGVEAEAHGQAQSINTRAHACPPPTPSPDWAWRGCAELAITTVGAHIPCAPHRHTRTLQAPMRCLHIPTAERAGATTWAHGTPLRKLHHSCVVGSHASGPSKRGGPQVVCGEPRRGIVHDEGVHHHGTTRMRCFACVVSPAASLAGAGTSGNPSCNAAPARRPRVWPHTMRAPRARHEVACTVTGFDIGHTSASYARARYAHGASTRTVPLPTGLRRFVR